MNHCRRDFQKSGNMRVFLLVWVILQSFKFAWCLNCVQAKDYVCNQIPTGYPPGVTSLVLFVKNMDEINSTVFNYTNLASVTSLTMTQCGITSIAPKAFTHFQSLKSLNLHNNGLSQVTSAWFTHKELLESLTITNNSIKALNDDSFHGFSGLSSLNLSQNQIHTITSDSFQSLFTLRHLDLSNNKLSYLSMDTFIPLNNTKMYLHGNLWDCSCTVYEFALYLRELKKALLLQNEMEVLCQSPPHQRGIPVWNLSKCVNPTIAVNSITTNGQPLNPGVIEPSTLISLIVVLCALVFVICVLSVLYHRKRERKHLLTIQPSPLEQESTKQTQAKCRTINESKFCNQRTNPNNKMVLKLDQTVLESEKASHIFQIYSKALDQKREVCTRAKSAGPEFFTVWGGRQMQTAVQEDLTEPQVDLMKDEEKLHCERSESKDKNGEHEREEEKEPEGTTEIKKPHQQSEKNDDHDADESNTSLKAIAKLNLMMDADVNEENTTEEIAQCKIFLSNASKNIMSIEDEAKNLAFNVARPFQEDNAATIQLLDDGENMPYFTIGPDPEKQSSSQIPDLNCAKASTKMEKSRPIRRVLSWPPTAAQWKKYCSQNQQVCNVSPNLIFLTQYTYQVSMFPPTITSPEMIPQVSGLEALHEHQSHIQIRDIHSLEPSRESMIQSYIQGLSTSAEDYVYINEQSDISRIPRSNYGAQPNMVTSYSPLCEETGLKAADGGSVRPNEASGKIKSKKKKTNQTSKCEQTGSGSGRQPWRRDKKGKKAERNNQRNPSRSGSGPSLSGCSPSDDNLLVGNEYTFIDLLHEVVENQGRWTRERWRQSHINKSKNKQFVKSQ